MSASHVINAGVRSTLQPSTLLTMSLLGPVFLLRDPALPWLAAETPAESGLLSAGPLRGLSDFWDSADVPSGLHAWVWCSCVLLDGCNAPFECALCVTLAAS